jgi:hypothetical protein
LIYLDRVGPALRQLPGERYCAPCVAKAVGIELSAINARSDERFLQRCDGIRADVSRLLDLKDESYVQVGPDFLVVSLACRPAA